MKIEPATAEDLRRLLAKIEVSTALLAKVERRRYREMTPLNGSNLNAILLQPGANQSELLNWPAGGGDDECSPCLETVTVDVDWTFHTDPSSSPGAQAGLDSIDLAFLSVYWGSVSHRADFDLMAGTSVTVSGYKVLVTASYGRAGTVGIDNVPVQIPQPTLAVRASLAPGTKHYGGIVGNARRTVDLGMIEGGAQHAKIEIPPWAKEIGIVNTAEAVPTMLVDQYSNANNGAPSRWTGNVGKGSVDTVPRESFSNWIAVTNTSQNAVTAKVIFYLGR